jgi:hypothetical protein
MILDEEQALHVKMMASEATKAALLAGDTGVGKTLMGIELMKALGVETTLIIAPPNTLKGWRNTATSQGVTLPFNVIDSSPKGKQHWQDLHDYKPGIYFVSRQFFALSGTDLEPVPMLKKGVSKAKSYKPMPDDFIRDENGEVVYTKGRDKLWSWSRVRPGLTIYDEVQAVNNKYSQGYTCLKEIKSGYRLAASATPQGNRFTGIWPVARWLWPNTINPKTGRLYVDSAQARWEVEWCSFTTDIYTYSGRRVTGEAKPGAFVNSLPCYIRMEADRTPVILRKCYVDLTPSQRRMYDEMEDDLLTWIDEHPLVAEFPMVQRIRLRQITLGEVTFNDEGEVDFADNCESSKFEALEKVLYKHHPGEPVLILTDSSKFARVVAKRLGPLAREWSGRVSQKQRDIIKAEFGDSVRYIVAVIPAMAEGTDGLQAVCNVEVWLSESLNGFLNIQAEGRLNRRGQEAKNIYQYKIMARNTDDDDGFTRRAEARRANHASLNKEAK